MAFMPNTSNVFAVGYDYSNKFLSKSIDNGTTWSNVSSNISLQFDPRDIVFTSTNNGWIVGQNGNILKTTNGGNNWQVVTSGSNNHLNNIQFIDQNVAYIGGLQALLKTNNGGNNWTKLTVPTNLYTTNISFVNESEGWIGTYYGLYKYSTSQCPTIPITIVNNCCQTPIPIIAPTNPTFCAGGNVTLMASGCAGTYTWTGGLTGTSITVSVAKTYKVTCRIDRKSVV